MTNPQETADLVTFTEEILNGKLHFLCSVVNTLFYYDCKSNQTFSYGFLTKTLINPQWRRIRNEEEIQYAEINMFEDNINDRDITDALVSKKIRTLYESG